MMIVFSLYFFNLLLRIFFLSSFTLKNKTKTQRGNRGALPVLRPPLRRARGERVAMMGAYCALAEGEGLRPFVFL
ncbi:hypothetical protein V6Z11_A08G265900 [Gossypium hirsutum]